ncbi:porin [Trinickia dinghuensis]|uniref:Porin n=1 Tax=Trinickia dinghuensis TaxID=2291023 RepID=A0A3D8K6H3_9BURK|nr:porin [Trinickia dinghuensis]RDV00929.1 porin [Trinickia dinghuensis]
MKKIAACAFAALICTAPAWGGETGENTSAGYPSYPSGSAVTIYGLIDQGVEFVNNVPTGKTTSNAVREGAGTATSYFGMRGSEDLGGGTHAIFDLQAGFAPNTGSSLQGGRLFGRQSYVGLDGPYGRLTFGRQYTMRFFANHEGNPFGTGAQGLTTLDNGFANARADNAVSYRVHLGGFEAGLNYSFGRDTVVGTTSVASDCPGETTPSTECREYSTLLKYEGKNWGITNSYERQYGGTSATWGGLTSPKKTDSRFIISGHVDISKASIGAGWIRRDDEGIATPKSNLFWLSSKVRVMPSVSIDSMVAQLKYDGSPNKALVLVLRGQYFLSKTTAVYLTGEHIKNGGKLALSASNLSPVPGAVPGGSQISIIAGIRHTF